MFNSKLNKRIEELEAQLAANKVAMDQMANYAYLIAIERTGRVNKFTFARKGQLHVIETMGLMSDDIPAWRKELLE